MNTIIFLLLLLLLVWLWQDSLRSREFAVKTCHEKCNELHLQLLDQTVALKSFSFRRNSKGRLVVFRHYNFEFSINGVDRYTGTVVVNRNGIEFFQLDHPEGTLILDQNDFFRPQ